MKVAFFGYREWALEIKQNLVIEGVQFTDIDNANIVLYYGWSKYIPKKIYKKKLCLILHPSPLPKYRGGSPIQHQIINGEKKSAVTICEVTGKLDAGDIYTQTPFSLKGSLNDIFRRIIDIGTQDTLYILAHFNSGLPIETIPQDNILHTTFKRRKPEESEIKDIKEMTAEEAYNFIRALADPYPNAFIVCKDGKKLYLTGGHL